MEEEIQCAQLIDVNDFPDYISHEVRVLGKINQSNGENGEISMIVGGIEITVIQKDAAIPAFEEPRQFDLKGIVLNENTIEMRECFETVFDEKIYDAFVQVRRHEEFRFLYEQK